MESFDEDFMPKPPSFCNLAIRKAISKAESPRIHDIWLVPKEIAAAFINFDLLSSRKVYASRPLFSLLVLTEKHVGSRLRCRQPNGWLCRRPLVLNLRLPKGAGKTRLPSRPREFGKRVSSLLFESVNFTLSTPAHLSVHLHCHALQISIPRYRW
jgi:hypothetical protein